MLYHWTDDEVITLALRRVLSRSGWAPPACCDIASGANHLIFDREALRASAHSLTAVYCPRNP